MILTVTITPATPAQAISLPVFQALASAAAAAHLDAVLFRRGPPPAPAFDPLVLLPALASLALPLGLGGSVPIDVLEPFHIARAFAAIDRLTDGRSALLLNTATPRDISAAAAMPAADRRARRIELFEVVGKLLDSWEDEVLLIDRPSGLFTDADRIHRINHDGVHYAVRGPLNAPRPLQGAPVIFAQASVDPVLASTVADIVLVDTAPLRQSCDDDPHFCRTRKRFRCELLADLSPHSRRDAVRTSPPAFAAAWQKANATAATSTCPADPAALEAGHRRRRPAGPTCLAGGHVARPPRPAPQPQPVRRVMYISPRLHLGLFIYPGGHHIAAWRHQDAASEHVTELDYFRQAAQLCERGKFDSFFVGDALAARESRGRVVGEVAINNLDPVSVCAAVAAVTENLGVVATLSTSFHDPFLIASKFATLDHLSGGRAGWNVVTTSSDQAAYNFGREPHMEKALRYRRAQDFVDVVRALWDAGEREVSYRGEFFQVDGSLGMPRPPQGWPVLVQAGGSPPGRAFAASIGEAIFTAQTTLPEAQAFRAAIHALMAARGRPPHAVAIQPGLSPILGSTMAEAFRKEEELDDLVHPRVGTWMMSEYLHFPLYDLPPDRLVPAAEIRAATPTLSPAAGAFLDRCERERLSIAAGGRILARSRTHQSFVGTPETLAEHMRTWLTEGACDGFNLLPAWFPGELAVFVDHAVPELQKRGIYRRDYEGPTLRHQLGLEVPPLPGAAKESRGSATW